MKGICIMPIPLISTNCLNIHWLNNIFFTHSSSIIIIILITCYKSTPIFDNNSNRN